uniref:Cation:proton antiporter n=1 Tax=Ignisphaera aggregans TaxID=334771 RepID=A0A7J3I7C5_9CREN
MINHSVYIIFLGLAFAKVFELILSRFKIPSIISWFVAGIVVGPYVLGLIDKGVELELFSRIASIFLMFYIGFSTNYNVVLRRISLSIIVSLAGVVATFFLCFAILYSITMNLYTSILLSIVLSNTASEMASSIMLTINKPFVYDIVTTASIVDDIIAIIAIFMMAIPILNGASYFSYMAFLIVVIISCVLIGLFRQYAKKVHGRLQTEVIHALSMALLGLSVAITVWMGVNELLVAYTMGLVLNIVMIRGDALLRSDTIAMDLADSINKLLHWVFLPLLFVYVALSIEIKMVNMYVFLPLFIASTIGKLIGCSLPVYVKTKRQDSITIGIIMMLRGSLENTLLSTLYLYSLIDKMLYSTSVVVSLTSTLLSLLLLYVLKVLR